MKLFNEKNFKLTLSRIILLLVFIGISTYILITPVLQLVLIIPDDASYYFKIAQNVSEGNNFSFDGINKTNGFQPLWQYLLIPIFLFIKASPETMFRICLIFQALILLLSGLLLIKIVSAFFSHKIVLLSTLLYIFVLNIHALNGMESAVLIFMIMLMFFAAYKFYFVEKQQSTVNDILFGILLGLTMLARLDMIFLGISISLMFIYRMFKDDKFNKTLFLRLMIILLFSSLVVVPYLIYNQLTFGNIMPISGVLKTSSITESLSVPIRSKFDNKTIIFTLIAFVYLIYFFSKSTKNEYLNNNIKFFLSCLAVLAATVCFHFIHTFLFMKWAIFPWHFIAYRIFIILLFCFISYLIFFKEFLKNNLYWTLILLITVFGIYWILNERFSFRSKENSWNVMSYKAAKWALENTNENEIFAMSDNGHFGFFSSRKAINLDGVVNNFEYQQAIYERKYLYYLKNKGVKYLVQYIWENDSVKNGNYTLFPVFSLLYGENNLPEYDELLLKRQNEVYSSSINADGEFKTVLKIWKIDY